VNDPDEQDRQHAVSVNGESNDQQINEEVDPSFKVNFWKFGLGHESPFVGRHSAKGMRDNAPEI
jgi:hypothetical protein